MPARDLGGLSPLVFFDMVPCTGGRCVPPLPLLLLPCPCNDASDDLLRPIEESLSTARDASATCRGVIALKGDSSFCTLTCGLPLLLSESSSADLVLDATVPSRRPGCEPAAVPLPGSASDDILRPKDDGDLF